MKLLLVAASASEIEATIQYLEENWEKVSFWEYKKEETSIFILITGTGSMFMSLGLSRFPDIKNIDYVINPGVGAAISRTLDLGRVYLLEEESFGDLGLEELNGSFHDLHDLKWMESNTFPFFKSKLTPKSKLNPTFLPTCSGITVNKIPGTTANIEAFEHKYHKDMMTLDGAACMYTCRIMDLECIQFRVNTRYVEPWSVQFPKLDEYIAQLNMRTIDIVEAMRNKAIY